MIAPLVAALTFLRQSIKKNKRETKRELSIHDKRELEKINQMEFFDAIDYLSKRDTGAGFQGDSKGDGMSGFRG